MQLFFQCKKFLQNFHGIINEKLAFMFCSKLSMIHYEQRFQVTTTEPIPDAIITDALTTS